MRCVRSTGWLSEGWGHAKRGVAAPESKAEDGVSALQASGKAMPCRPVTKEAEPPIVEPSPASPCEVGRREAEPRPALVPYFPDEIGTYWEPFVGGGAVFFAFAKRIKHAILSDTNEELVLTYQVVKCNVEALIDRLRQHKSEHEKRLGRSMGAARRISGACATPSPPTPSRSRLVSSTSTRPATTAVSREQPRQVQRPGGTVQEPRHL